MREYVFTLEYERGVDPIADVFIDHPEAIARSVACNVVGEDMWRIDRFTGPEPAIDALEGLVRDANRCNECPEGACDSYREHELLEHDPTTATVYTYRQGIDACPALPYHATEHGLDEYYVNERLPETGREHHAERLREEYGL